MPTVECPGYPLWFFLDNGFMIEKTPGPRRLPPDCLMTLAAGLSDLIRLLAGRGLQSFCFVSLVASLAAWNGTG